MKVAHQPRALPRQRGGTRALLLADETCPQFFFGLAELDHQSRGEAVDLVQRPRESPGQPGADRDQHDRIGQAREEDAVIGNDPKHREHVVSP